MLIKNGPYEPTKRLYIPQHTRNQATIRWGLNFANSGIVIMNTKKKNLWVNRILENILVLLLSSIAFLAKKGCEMNVPILTSALAMLISIVAAPSVLRKYGITALIDKNVIALMNSAESANNSA
jgi:hypothetical protein